jgi:pSer/pThr/pTyr-binding forkhead associated (FHA) protein/ribosomal protein L40E
MSIGLVCPTCDALLALGVTSCSHCGRSIGTGTSLPAVNNVPAIAKADGISETLHMPMKICPSCSHEVPVADRFCGQCGARMDSVAAAPIPQMASGGKTMFFSGVQAPGRAKLILVRGDIPDGVSYQLNGTEHIAGREEGAILFPDDTLLSPRHANFFYKDNKLFVRDEESVNGVFMRMKQPVPLDSGSVFLVGEQLLEVEAVAPDMGPQPDAEGTYFYASPRRASKIKLIQRLRGGDIGLIYRAREEKLTIGREHCDVNFPDDPFISGHHAELTTGSDGSFLLTDMGSKNGSFTRITDEVPLVHGDYVFIGQQLLRVEIS